MYVFEFCRSPIFGVDFTVEAEAPSTAVHIAVDLIDYNAEYSDMSTHEHCVICLFNHIIGLYYNGDYNGRHRHPSNRRLKTTSLCWTMSFHLMYMLWLPITLMMAIWFILMR